MKYIKEEIINFAQNINIKKIKFAKSKILAEKYNELKYRTECGYLGEMDFLKKTLHKRTNPNEIIKNAKTIIVIAEPYTANIKFSSKIKIAKYAIASDYHETIYNKLQQLQEFISEKYNAKSYISVDAGAVLEKEWAKQAGIGWQGKNSLIISEEFGSYFNIGVLITDLEIEISSEEIKDKCGNCNLCMNSCPTKAIVAPGIIDVKKCISYLTTEAKLSEEINYEKEIKETAYIFGCDICQDVCPYNSKFQNNKQEISDVKIQELLNETENILFLSNKQFSEKFNNYAIKRLRLNRLKRNYKLIKNS